MLRQLIKDYLINSANVDAAKLEVPGVRISELGVDSLGIIEMLFEVEDKYGFQIENPMRYADMSLDEVVQDMETAVRARNNGEIPQLHE